MDCFAALAMTGRASWKPLPPRHCEQRNDEAIQLLCDDGLLRGACHLARIRATRWHSNDDGELPRRGFRHECAPAVEGGDVAGAGDVGGLGKKTLYAAALGEAGRAERQRRGGRGAEISQWPPAPRP